jgi:hypothetical protein
MTNDGSTNNSTKVIVLIVLYIFVFRPIYKWYGIVTGKGLSLWPSFLWPSFNFQVLGIYLPELIAMLCIVGILLKKNWALGATAIAVFIDLLIYLSAISWGPNGFRFPIDFSLISAFTITKVVFIIYLISTAGKSFLKSGVSQ